MFEESDMKERNGKIPIKIAGGPNFAVVGGVDYNRRDHFLHGTFCGGVFGQNLEEGIQIVIEDIMLGAKIYLKRMINGMECGDYEDLAFKIANYRREPSGLFFLTYHKENKQEIEPQLGKFNSLEAIVK